MSFSIAARRGFDSGGVWTSMTVPSASSSSGVSMGTITNETPFTAAPVICFNTNGAGTNSTCVFTFERGGESNTIEVQNVYGGTSNYYYLDTEDYCYIPFGGETGAELPIGSLPKGRRSGGSPFWRRDSSAGGRNGNHEQVHVLTD